MPYTFTDTPLLKKISLPSGTTYFVADAESRNLIANYLYDELNQTAKDTVARTALTGDAWDETARQAISGGISFITPWTETDFTSTTAPTAAKLATVPAVTVYYNNGQSSATGTLSADSAQAGAFYLLFSKVQAGQYDIYDEYVPVLIPGSGTKRWEKLGTTGIVSINLEKDTAIKSGKVVIPQKTVSPTGGTTDNVLGESTTFTNASSSVSFGAHSKDDVLGTSTTFTTSVTPSVSNLKATSSKPSVTATGTVDVKTYSADSGKLVTTTITPISGTVQATNTVFGTSTTASKVTTTAKTASKATAGTKVSLAKRAASDTTVATGASTTSTVNTDFLKSISVTDETLIIGAAKLTTTSVRGTDGVEEITPYTFADVSCSLVSASDVSVPVVSSNSSVEAASASESTITVATGTVSSSGTGSSVVIGLDSESAGSAMSGAQLSDAPTITLALGATAGTGVVSVATGISSATTSANSDDTVSAITGLGAATAAAQTITVGTNDKVTALTSAGSGTIASYEVNVTPTETIQAVINATTN